MVGFKRWFVRLAFGGLALAVFALVALLAGEIAARRADGFSLASLQLVRTVPAAPSDPLPATERRDTSRDYLASIKTAPGMQRDWFDPPLPELTRRPPDTVLVQAADRFAASGALQEAVHVFNWNYLRSRLCSNRFYRSFPGFAFVYDAPHGADHPRFRFPRNAMTAQGLITNQFGWRGPPIERRKPARTIRIAFVGSSTTVNDHSYRHSYPELVVIWLNRWLEAEKLDLRAEVINAAREGITSTDIAAIVRDEVLPLAPDMIVYLEGANQFWPDVVRPVFGARLERALANTEARLQAYSALAPRLHAAVRRLLGADVIIAEPGAEPPKPLTRIVWPPDVDEHDPPLQHPKLPANLSMIVRDLTDMEQRARQAGVRFVLCSFQWLVHDGMQLDPVRDRMLYDYLNVSYGAYTYREMARVAAFQNRVFGKFAKVHGDLFVDLAGQMPRDPNLFYNATHATYDGVRLQAWIVAQQLASDLRTAIAAGELPRPPHDVKADDAEAADNERTIEFDCNAPRQADGTVAVRLYAQGLAIPPGPGTRSTTLENPATTARLRP